MFIVGATAVTCNKSTTDYDVYFYTDEITGDPGWTLYVDDKNQGDLAFFNGNPQCGVNNSLAGLNHLVLQEGKYWYEAIDNLGVTRCKGYICFEQNQSSSSSGGGTRKGGQSGIQEETCVLVKLFE